ncbi:MAG: Gfo/Idh/MocA family oxidoreductase [Actinomycetota bacterium]
MRIGVLGVGRIGRAHVANLARLDRVDQVLVHDPELDDAGGLGPTVEAVAGSAELIDRSDGVVVATPTARHTEDLRDVADAGKPCFCEKPVSLDLDGTIEALDHAAAAGIDVQVGFQRRFDPGFVEIKRLIDTGALGRLYLIRAASHDHEPPHESYLPLAGSIFRDMLIHDFDALAWLSGESPAQVHATGTVLVDEMFARHGDVDTCTATVTLASGALAVLTGTRQNGVGYDHRTEVVGSLDAASAGLGTRMPMRSADPGGPQPTDPYPTFPERFAHAYAAEMDAFTALVAGEGPNRCPGDAALDALRLALAADRSLAEGRPVPVD